jgi:hypothetical protein
MTTIRDLLFDANDRRTLGEKLAEAGAVPAAAAKVVPIDQLVEVVWDLLDMPLGDIVRSAWDRHELVQKAKANTLGKTGVLERVSIAGHTLKSQHRPKVEIDVAGASIPALEFDLAVALRLDAAVINVANGAITSIAPASGSAEASLATKGRTLCQRKLAHVALPAIASAGVV